jgi:hypothetical protein
MFAVRGNVDTVIGLAVVGEVNVTETTLSARYGPTNGPPDPTGAAPAGCTNSVPVSRKA